MQLYTSGTTAAPKAALLRHRHLMSYVLGTVEFGAAERGRGRAGQRAAVPRRRRGRTCSATSTPAGGSSTSTPSTPSAWLDDRARRAASPTRWWCRRCWPASSTLLDARPSGDARRCARSSYGGARMPRPVLEARAGAVAGTGFVNAYGLTETSSTIALLGPDDHRAVAASPTTAGCAIGAAGCPRRRARDPRRGRQRAAGRRARAAVRARRAGLGRVRRQHRSVDDGWFPTRDRGWVDDDGYLFIEGRADDTIIRGGENIAPAEIEDVLLEHPGVADAAVVGVPDDEWGQRHRRRRGARPRHRRRRRGAAGVVRARGCGPRRPRTWSSFRDELPRTETGKLLRRQVLDELVP